jgi:peroxiredoxin
MFPRIALVLSLATAAYGADPAAIDRAVSALRDSAAKAPAAVAVDLQARAAGLLRERHPAASVELARAGLDRLRATPGLTPGDGARQTLVALLPDAAGSIPELNPPPAEAAGAKPAGGAVPPEIGRALTDIGKGLRKMRSLSTDAKRASLVLDLAKRIQKLPAPYKLAQIGSLANLVTEGDLGAKALDTVASVMAEAMRESNPAALPAGVYLQLANLVRYEHVAAPPADAGLDAAAAYLALRERLVEDAGFSLTGLDGKTYSLEGLRGRVALVNFWATWCPPCRKEMPDMQKIYDRFKDKGLVVVGISDDEREAIEKYIAQQKYTFPILPDSGRAVSSAFGINGIPQTFLFDRSGNLAAETIDMRTEAQFLKLLKQAGIE